MVTAQGNAPCSDTELARRPLDSDAADNGSKSLPKGRVSDDKGSGSKSKSPQRHRRDYKSTRLKRDYSRGRHAHVADGDCSTTESDSEEDEHNFLALAVKEDNQPARFADSPKGKSESFSLPPALWMTILSLEL